MMSLLLGCRFMSGRLIIEREEGRRGGKLRGKGLWKIREREEEEHDEEKKR